MSHKLKSFLFGSPFDLVSYTDPISNTVLLSGVETFDAAQKITYGTLPIEYLGKFIHEATHHACFFTPVGRSLAALSISAAGETSPKIANEETFEMRRRDILKYYCFREFFNPLLEGLALFAELDAFPAGSPVISDPMMKVSYIFTPDDLRGALPLDPYGGKWDYIRKLLLEARTSESFVSWKSNILSLGLDNRGGYLLGYLFIKGYWLRLISECRKLLDADLFLSFMISYWFEDDYFADLIIKDTRDVGEDISNVWAYFQDRIPYLTLNVNKFVNEFETLTPNTGPNNEAHRPSYCNGDSVNDVILLAQQNLRAIGKYDTLNWDLFGNRQFFRFATCSVDVEVSPQGYVTVRDQKTKSELLHGEAVSGSSIPSSGPGSVEATLQMDGQIFICIFCEKDFVAVIDLYNGKWNDESQIWMGETMLSRLVVEEFLQEIEEKRKQYHSYWGNLISINISTAKDLAYKKYSSIGLTDKDGKYDFGKIDLIRQNGLIDIFDQDSALLDFASKVSLIANHGFAFAKIASQLKLPEDQFLTYLHRVEDAFLSALNINPFFIIGKRLKGSMI
jgi:hypothetical protein